MKEELYKYLKEYKKYCQEYEYDFTFYGFMAWFESYVMHIEKY